MDRDRLHSALDAFAPAPAERRVVVRQAIDLADAGRYEADTGHELTVSVIEGNLRDAPEEALVDRWNWWIGSLTVAYGGYERFQIRTIEES